MIHNREDHIKSVTHGEMGDQIKGDHLEWVHHLGYRDSIQGCLPGVG